MDHSLKEIEYPLCERLKETELVMLSGSEVPPGFCDSFFFHKFQRTLYSDQIN